MEIEMNTEKKKTKILKITAGNSIRFVPHNAKLIGVYNGGIRSESASWFGIGDYLAMSDTEIDDTQIISQRITAIEEVSADQLND